MTDQVDLVDPTTLDRWLDGRSFDEARRQFDDEGFIIFERVLTEPAIERLRSALDPYLADDLSGRDDFEGFESNRVYGLLAKDPVFADLVAHPLPLAFAEADLGPSCLLSALLAINLKPGESVQPWHHDDGFLGLPWPRASYGVSTFWAIDAMTTENGATELIPRSHRPDFEGVRPNADAFRPANDGLTDPNADPAPRSDAVEATMPAGSLMITKGTLIHRGGANRSDAPRLIVTPQYCPGWARQIENMMAATPPEIAAGLPKRVRQLIGYSIHAAFMGYVDGRHPEKLLSELGVSR